MISRKIGESDSALRKRIHEATILEGTVQWGKYAVGEFVYINNSFSGDPSLIGKEAFILNNTLAGFPTLTYVCYEVSVVSTGEKINVTEDCLRSANGLEKALIYAQKTGDKGA